MRRKEMKGTRLAPRGDPLAYGFVINLIQIKGAKLANSNDFCVNLAGSACNSLKCGSVVGDRTAKCDEMARSVMSV